MPKFFVSPDAVRGRFLTLDGENAAHAKVLRLRRGDSVLVCDGCGTDYRCTISDCSPQQVCLVINSTEESGAEPPVACSVYMAYAKADKLEHVIQKATELGAYEIAAFPSSRCVLKLDAASAEKKRERWQKIAASAAAQSGRGRIPQVLVMPSFEDGRRAAFPTKRSCLRSAPDFRSVRSVRVFSAARLRRCARSAPSCSPPARWTDAIDI